MIPSEINAQGLPHPPGTPRCKGIEMGHPDSEGSIILPGHDIHVLFSGQIWKTEDVKMSVPRQAVMEEPSTEPLSPRGTCLEILTHIVLLHPSPFALARRTPELREVLPAQGLYILLLISLTLYLPDRNNFRAERFTWAHGFGRYHWEEGEAWWHL